MWLYELILGFHSLLFSSSSFSSSSFRIFCYTSLGAGSPGDEWIMEGLNYVLLFAKMKNGVGRRKGK